MINMPTNIAMPDEWITVEIPVLDAKIGSNHIYVPAHDIQIAPSYPTDNEGNLLSGMKQKGVANFLKDYNEHHDKENEILKFMTMYENAFVREKLGSSHYAFDENFARNGRPWRWGYVADFTRPYGSGAEGIGQDLVTRIAYWLINGEEVELGPVTIAPDGMVPLLSREEMEKMIGDDGLKKLEKLRGYPIEEKDNEIVKVTNALGYPQFTLGNDATDENNILIPHSHHSYRPKQNYEETFGVRCVIFSPHSGRRCFDVDLTIGPECSSSDGSFPLVRGERMTAEITRASQICDVGKE